MDTANFFYLLGGLISGPIGGWALRVTYVNRSLRISPAVTQNKNIAGVLSCS